MPKISKRRVTLVQHRQTAFLSEARKVSFEDGSELPQSPRQLPRSMSSSSSLPRITACRNMASGSVRRRPTPSMALSELDSQTSLILSPQGLPESCSSPLSFAGSEDSSTCSSPWGQFVDFIPSTPETENSFGSERGSSYHQGSTHSSHCSQPYFKPKRFAISHKPAGVLSGFILSIPIEADTTTDEVAGAMRRMHV